MKTFTYKMACVQIHERGPIAIARALGVVAPGCIAQIVRDSSDWHQRPGLSVKVMDYSSAVLAASSEQMMVSAAQFGAPGITPPAALIAGADNVRLLRDYASASLAAGIVKAVFLTIDDALRWAERQAVVLDYWTSRSDAVQSGPAAAQTVWRVC